MSPYELSTRIGDSSLRVDAPSAFGTLRDQRVVVERAATTIVEPRASLCQVEEAGGQDEVEGRAHYQKFRNR